MHMHKHQHLHRRQGGLTDMINDATSSIENEVQGLTNNNRDDDDHHHHESSDDDTDSGDGGKRSPDNGGDAATAVSIVYVTASPTFTGAIAGYSTLGMPAIESAPPAAASTEVPDESPKTTPASPKPSSRTSPAKAASSAAATTTVVPQAATTSDATQKTSLIKSIRVTSSSPSMAAATSIDATTDASASAAAASATTAPTTASSAPVHQEGTGLTGGAKAGIAFGAIIGVLALLAAAFALYRYKKNRDEEAYVKNNNEKTNPFADAAAAVAPSHMRPITPPPQLAPVTMAGAAKPVTTGQRDIETAQAANPANPFGQHAETVQGGSSNPVNANQMAPSSGNTALAAGAGAGALATAAVAKRGNGPEPLETNRSQSPGLAIPASMPSPSPSQFSNSSMTSAAIAGGAPATNVHRIQLDFKPSMDDELELRAGQLVRLLHEYDDGWALCIRLDRSQQGVVPRTCLSTRPVKPRNGPPRGPPPPGSRATQGSPIPSGRMASPNLSMDPQRSASPALSPNPVKRSMSPGPYGGGPQQQMTPPVMSKPRSNSVGDVHEKRTGAPGPSPVNHSAKAAAQNSTNALPAPISIPAITQGNSVPASPVTRKPVPRQSA